MAWFKTEPKQAEELTESSAVGRNPNAPKKLIPRLDRDVMDAIKIAEYRAVAKDVGISDQDMMVEEFRLFLSQNDMPVFNHKEVVKYMDELVVKDNPTGLGWHWVPVRKKDTEVPMRFGQMSSLDNKITPASDYYESHRFKQFEQFSYSGDWRKGPSRAYSRTLPLHALKKIAFIEKNFTTGKPIFLVTDYVTAPHVVINPDPFLMAVIPNSAVAHGKGRFVIDVWDEPGFGITKQVL